MSSVLEPCAGLPGPAKAVCDAQPLAGVGGAVGEAVGGAVSGATDSVLDSASTAVAQSASFFLERVASAMDATTQLDVSAPWFLRQYAVMFGLSAFLTLLLLLLNVVKEVAQGRWAEALRAGTVYYLAAVVASAFAPAVVYLLVQLSDAVCAALVAGTGQDTDAFFDTVGGALTSITPPTALRTGPFTLIVASLLTIGCAVVLWVELLLRSAIVYVSLLFAAPTFSGLVDRALWRHSKRWLYFTVCVVFAKPVVVAVLLLAAAATGSAGTDDGFSSLFIGIALMLVAIFCVALLFRLVPNAGDQLAGALGARRELRAATPSLPLPAPANVVKQSVQSHLLGRGSARSSARMPLPGGAGPSIHKVAAARLSGTA